MSVLSICLVTCRYNTLTLPTAGMNVSRVVGTSMPTQTCAPASFNPASVPVPSERMSNPVMFTSTTSNGREEDSKCKEEHKLIANLAGTLASTTDNIEVRQAEFSQQGIYKKSRVH